MALLYSVIWLNFTVRFTNAPTLQQTASNIKVRIPDDCVTCGHQMFVGIFFDGTDNNMDRDKPKGAHTNVVRLYDAYPQVALNDRFYKIYVPGVGTPFKEIGETEADAKGSPFGTMGLPRINHYNRETTP